ncbi:hypothetical protein [uncultured Oscillibacter sp.]|uniref:hypothetical protein n=1 Tax=uncultured Oscillibacter sp. TaxID=876091 RepID=UPI0025F33C40|nr:hypothetical protein [uncultured Oscillibacter sp.]
MTEEKDPFAFLTLTVPKRAPVFPGSVGTFRYRLVRSGKENEGTIEASVYENICFEKAQNIETQTFPWSEDGMAQIRAWLAEKLRERGAQPFTIFGGR